MSKSFKEFFTNLSKTEFDIWSNKCMSTLWSDSESSQSSANYGHYIILSPWEDDAIELFCNGNMECSSYNFGIPIVNLVQYMKDQKIEWHN